MIKKIEEMNQQQYISYLQQLRTKIKQKHHIAQKSLVSLNITQKNHIKTQTLDMMFYFMPELAKKMEKKQNNQTNPVKFNPFLNPQKDLWIQNLGERHTLLFNKFNIYHNHLLVITKQFQSQQTKITHGDMINSTLVLQALNGILFFNGGLESGASQQHKHLQILPNEARQLPIFNKIYDFIDGYKEKQPYEIIRFMEFNFLHGIIKIQGEKRGNKLGEGLFEGYNKLYNQLIEKSQGKYKYYNLIGCESFILMVIRKKQHAFGKISVNSLGFMGSLLFRDPVVMQAFKNQHTPQQILQNICQKS